jgi:hypothetical protein
MDAIRNWVKEIEIMTPEKQKEILRKIQLIYGSTEEKAKDYLKLVMGVDELNV